MIFILYINKIRDPERKEIGRIDEKINRDNLKF